jgi:hypothetical protein
MPSLQFIIPKSCHRSHVATRHGASSAMCITHQTRGPQGSSTHLARKAHACGSPWGLPGCALCVIAAYSRTYPCSSQGARCDVL